MVFITPASGAPLLYIRGCFLLLDTRYCIPYTKHMVLSDRDIKKALQDKQIIISPVPHLAEQLGSNSIDLRLGNTFRIFEHSKHGMIDPFDKEGSEGLTREIVIPDGERFIMHPGDFVLGTTIEHIEIPDDLIGSLEGRSSIGRLGVIIHSTASSIECGFRGHITLELANMGKMAVALHPGMRICSVAFSQLSSPAEVPYYKKKGAKYVGQTGPDESKLFSEG
ncbi:dCTP deaminase [soil metagenome]